MTPRLSRGFFGILLVMVALSTRAEPSMPHAPPTREALIGAWQLVTIQYLTSDGPQEDPFYGQHPQGMLVYDASNSMSVQIVGANRPSLEAESRRSGTAHPDRSNERKAAAYDSYYAYFGTWDVDGAASVVTHHVQHSLIPSESGLVYTQTIELEGEHLTFINRSPEGSSIIERRKLWRRIHSDSPAPAVVPAP
jgi:hypothetical protein